jgi:3-oxoacyl-[acyl-carrier protein] reductase
MSKLAGKSAIVTGSGRGIGREVAMKLAAEGARVVVNDLDADPAQEVVELIRANGGEAVACVGSVTAPILPTASSRPRSTVSRASTSSSTTPATPGTT